MLFASAARIDGVADFDGGWRTAVGVGDLGEAAGEGFLGISSVKIGGDGLGFVGTFGLQLDEPCPMLYIGRGNTVR